MMGDTNLVRASFDSACVKLEKEVDEHPNDHRYSCSLKLSYACFEQKEDAIRESRLAVKMLPISRDAFDAPDKVKDLALIYCIIGLYELAIEQLERLFSVGGSRFHVSVPFLRLDACWAPVHNKPQFLVLLEKYSGGDV
jgi:tetratricopeptide (TPR) repeat protein